MQDLRNVLSKLNQELPLMEYTDLFTLSIGKIYGSHVLSPSKSSSFGVNIANLEMLSFFVSTGFLAIN